MPVEFRQPSIPTPDITQNLFWEKISRTHCDWLRKAGPQFGMDVPKLILGEILRSIIGEDANAFGPCFNSKLSTDSKTNILELMNWEVSVPETPELIRRRLKKVIKFIEPLDFNDEANYEKGRKKWRAMKDWVDEQSSKRQDWDEALDYHHKMGTTLNPYWQEFLNGRVLFPKS